MVNTEEWYNNIVLVLKPNRTVWLSLHPVRFNQTLTRPLHRGPTVNVILPMLIHAQYLTVIYDSFGYHNLNLDKKSLYLTISACQFVRYRYTKLPFGAALAEDMIQQKKYKIFKDLPIVFGTADDILIVGYDANGHDHDTLQKRVTRDMLKKKS